MENMKLIPLFAKNEFDTINQLVKNNDFDYKEVSEKGSNLFLHAAYYAQFDLMTYFYDKGIDVNQLVKGETSAFSLAATSLEGIQTLKKFVDSTSAEVKFYADDVLSSLSKSEEHEAIFQYLIDNFDIKDDLTNVILKYYPQGLSYYFNQNNIDPYAFVLNCIQKDKHLSPFMILKEDAMPEQDEFLNQIKSYIKTYDKATFLAVKNAVKSYMSTFKEANIHHCYMSNHALSTIMSIMYLDDTNPLNGLCAELDENEEYAYEKKLKSICKKYNLHNISIENAFLKPDLVYYLENSLETVKKFFHLHNHEVGEGVLELNFVAREINGPQGYFHSPTTSITITESCGLSVFLHEYTHFRQYAGFSASTTPLREEIKPAIKTLMSTFESHYSTTEELKDVLHKFASLYLNNVEDFNQIVCNLVDFKTEWKYMKKSFEKVIARELNEVYDGHKKAYTQILLSEVKLRIESFKHGSSLASNYYKKLNQLKREHIKTNYWTEPVELHARMNEALANHDNYQDKNPLFNQFILKTLKPHLDKFNELLVANARMLKKEQKFIQRQIILKH
jgi:hypothetical protein